MDCYIFTFFFVLIYITIGSTALGNESAKSMARIVRLVNAPVIDGLLNDEIWKTAPWHDEFTQRRPQNGAKPTLKTEFAVAFDDNAIYFGVRCHVPNRDQIVTRLTRRDSWGDFDNIGITLSPRGDLRTGFSFEVNPQGVMLDKAWYNDGTSDSSWDAVWQAKTRIKEKMWTVEIVIPLDQLRFKPGRTSWGLQVTRWISSRQEGLAFNPVPLAAHGWISLAGILDGIQDIKPKNPLLITSETYFSYRNTTSNYASRGQDGFTYGAGAYVKTGIGSDLVLDIAINPDFGQVEVDQIVLNLSAYETQFPEKRPFFLEGAGLFKTPIGLFYSRRLGAEPPEPSLTADEYISNGPTATPILGAAKITGRSDNGFSVGIIEAMLLPTQFRVENDTTDTAVIRAGNPWTNAVVTRFTVEPGDNSTFGMLVTALNPVDSQGAYSGGLDWSVFTPGREYSFKGQFASSLRTEEVSGREESHGAALWTQLAREGGEYLRLYAGYELYDDGFDPNDMGYLYRNDLHHPFLRVVLRQADRFGPFAQIFAGVNVCGHYNTDGLRLGENGSIYLTAKWNNDWVTEIGGFGHTRRYDDKETRGGPPIFKPGELGGWVKIRAPERKLFGGQVKFSGNKEPHGYALRAGATFELRSTNLTLSLSPGINHKIGDLAWVDTFDEDNPEESTVIARINLDKIDLTLKSTLVIVRDLTFQLHTQLLVARADYNHYMLLHPDSSSESWGYSDADVDFTRTDLSIQALFRWEYLPGSALYIVYTNLGFFERFGSNPELSWGIRNMGEREQLFILKISHMFGIKI